MLTDEQEEAMDRSRSLCVTAGAGGGKTHTLVERYIRLIKDGVAVPEILALTFTEKAAAEMKHRVRTAVLRLEGPERDRVKDDINWCRISTFHAFCADVLRTFPLEAGVPPSFEVLEEVERDEVLGEAMDRLLSPPLDREAEAALVRLLTDVPRHRLAEGLAYLYERRSEISGFLSSFDTAEDLLARWEALGPEARRKEAGRFLDDPGFMAAVSNLAALAAAHGGDRDAGSRYLAAAAPFLRGIRSNTPAEAAGEALGGLMAVKGIKNLGTSKVFGPDLARLRSAYSSLQEAFGRLGTGAIGAGPDHLSEQAAAMLVDLKRVFGEYQRIAGEIKRERIAVDFEDLIAIVHDLFARNPALLREEFTDRFKHILVDEFQDTDPIQSDIIWMMAGGAKAAEKLFIVGDPKQSIYLFRNVDVSMFKEFQERIVNVLKGGAVHLDTNFRSTPQVIGFVNHVFGQLMGEAREKWEFEYQGMKVCGGRKEDRGSVELLLLPEDAEASEAEFVARRVQETVAQGAERVYWSPDGQEHLDEPRPPGYGDIAILLRAKTRLREFEEALDRYGVPYRVHAGLGFFEREEIVDLRNLMAFLSDREDDLSLYGVLRSPYFAVSDERLFLLSARGRGSLWRKLGQLEEGGDPLLRAARETLARWQRYAARLTVPRLLSKVLAESGIFAVYGGLPDGDLRIANLEKLMSLARGAQSSGFLALADLMQWLRRSMEGGAKEGLAPLAGGDGSVKIMTVHAAKGLEFPIVFVPEMNFHRKEDARVLAYSGELGLGIDAPDAGKGHRPEASLAKRLIEAEQTLQETAERKRLLYVALTRAKDHLVMCGRAPGERDREKEMWINWIIQAAGLGPEDIAAGLKRLGPDLELTIRTDPLSARAEEKERGGAARRTAEEVAPFIMAGPPLAFPPSGPVLSPSSAGLGDEGAPGRTRLPEITCSAGARCDERPAVRGTIVHEVLAGKDAASVLRKYGLGDPPKVQEYARLGGRFRHGPVMKGAAAAYHEIGFFAKVAGNFYQGRIDLLVQNEDGSWLVVDHKTGSFDGAAGERKAAGHRAQMGIYQAAAEGLLGRKVGLSLYLVDEDRMLPLDDGPGTAPDLEGLDGAVPGSGRPVSADDGLK